MPEPTTPAPALSRRRALQLAAALPAAALILRPLPDRRAAVAAPAPEIPTPCYFC